MRWWHQARWSWTAMALRSCETVEMTSMSATLDGRFDPARPALLTSRRTPSPITIASAADDEARWRGGTTTRGCTEAHCSGPLVGRRAGRDGDGVWGGRAHVHSDPTGGEWRAVDDRASRSDRTRVDEADRQAHHGASSGRSDQAGSAEHHCSCQPNSGHRSR